LRSESSARSPSGDLARHNSAHAKPSQPPHPRGHR
jgi:hypothetical protein